MLHRLHTLDLTGNAFDNNVALPKEVDILQTAYGTEIRLDPPFDIFSWFRNPGGTYPRPIRVYRWMKFMDEYIGGSIPSELCMYNNLKFLVLSNVSLAGSIPTQLGLMTQLKGLALDSNQLTGSIPLSSVN